jgi:hypothetical protein
LLQDVTKVCMCACVRVGVCVVMGIGVGVLWALTRTLSVCLSVCLSVFSCLKIVRKTSSDLSEPFVFGYLHFLCSPFICHSPAIASIAYSFSPSLSVSYLR